MDYPQWVYYPNSEAPPRWAREFVDAVASVKDEIDSVAKSGLTSDVVLSHLRPHLVALGYSVEASKKRVDKIRRPVLFGEAGRERVAYEVDAVQDELGVLVEVEAGRGAMGNAVYRDLVRSSLVVGARFLALGVMSEYRYGAAGVTASYRDARDLLDAIYASGRLRFPFEGVLLFGY
jgi:hypothetical protein